MSAGMGNSARLSIGVDLDNTIISYDSLLHATASQQDLIGADVAPTKRQIRDAVRKLPDGDIQWQKLQSLVYGPKLGGATLIHGVKEFFQTCQQHHVPVCIISHKTEYAPFDDTKTKLRTAALDWMGQNGLLEKRSTGLSEESVWFEPTRQEKLERIGQVGCTHFIDDLEETFLEEFFPQHVEKILYSPSPQSLSIRAATVLTSWEEIRGHFFNAGN